MVPEMMKRKALGLQGILCQFLQILSPTMKITTMRRAPRLRLISTIRHRPILDFLQGGLDDRMVEESMDLITEEDSRTRKTFFDIHEVR